MDKKKLGSILALVGAAVGIGITVLRAADSEARAALQFIAMMGGSVASIYIGHVLLIVGGAIGVLGGIAALKGKQIGSFAAWMPIGAAAACAGLGLVMLLFSIIGLDIISLLSVALLGAGTFLVKTAR